MKNYLVVLFLSPFLFLHAHERPPGVSVTEEEVRLEKPLEEAGEKIVKKETWTCPFCGKQFSKPVAHQCVPVSLSEEKTYYTCWLSDART